MTMRLEVMRCHPDARLPSYAHQGDAGMDICSVEKVALLPGERSLVATGIKLAVPIGFEVQVRPKSGLAIKHGITCLNTPGTIDAGYRGEVKVILYNAGQEPYLVEKGSKIAQLIVARVEQADIAETGSLDDTARGEGGFGSTGV